MLGYWILENTSWSFLKGPRFKIRLLFSIPVRLECPDLLLYLLLMNVVYWTLGSGKTLIAVLLLKHIIYNELNNRAAGKPHRISFFLV